MFFIPYGHIQIKSNLKRDEIERRLARQLEPRRLISGFARGDHKYFEGEIENGQFKINRVIEFKNSFNPVIIGTINGEFDHTLIYMTLRLDFVAFAALFLIWFGLVSIFVLPDINSLFRLLIFGEGTALVAYLPASYYSQHILLSFVVFSFFHLFMMVPFNIEVGKVTKYLEELFVKQ